MAKCFLFLFFLSFLFSCENKATNASEPDSVGTSNRQEDDTTTALKAETAAADKSRYYIWEVDAQSKTKIRNPDVQDAFYNVDTLIAGLNGKYPQIKLEKKGFGHDTLYTEIKDARYLTEQMGSAGAEQYIAQTVLNLTSVSGINCVRIDFSEGSHASPDAWCKEMFGDYKEAR